ncbi:hypothetical protein [Azospirillum sp. TSO22-1]|uniref:hypothetical protein n=1 Tax=Azospirillum sp. TSO22-1 TaxID=716789 RepID=UPI000D61DC85|nr:hypothetical protein [Azospirillum sp. TSO22-1]PWC54922.1 hypothetical protein TSO221_06805 [Azospirillum sp. TSO22-1]
MPPTGTPPSKTRIRTFPEDPDTIGIDITGREFLLNRNDALELALKILTACGVQLLESADGAPPGGKP